MLPLEIMGFSESEQRAARRALSGAGQSHRLRAQISLAVVRRHAAARLDRPRAVVRSGTAADGRAVRRARRDRPRSSQRAAAAALGQDRQDGGVRHPLDSRSGVPVDQDRGDVRRGRAGSSTSSTATFRASRTLEIRETPEFLEIAQRVRVGLCAPGIPMTTERFAPGVGDRHGASPSAWSHAVRRSHDRAGADCDLVRRGGADERFRWCAVRFERDSRPLYAVGTDRGHHERGAAAAAGAAPGRRELHGPCFGYARPHRAVWSITPG